MASSAVIPLNQSSGDAIQDALPPIILPVSFTLQSYLDNSFENLTPTPGNAILEQPTNRGIVDSTLKQYQAGGFAVGLAPWSESPMSVIFRKPDSAALVLRPGHILVPYPKGFTGGFDYGLPFGWLGGGLSALYVFRSRDSLPDWSGTQKEVLFHRFRTKIITTSLTQPAVQRRNWPTRFPWMQSWRGNGTNAENQTGKPIVSVKPTRTLLRLNGAIPMPAGLPTRIVFWGTDDFDADSTGTPSANQNVFYDFTWPANLGPGPGMAAHSPVVVLPPEIAALASNTYGVTFEVEAGSALLTAAEGPAAATIDVLRYGTL